MNSRPIASFVGFLALASCAGDAPDAESSSAGAPFRPVASVQELMLTVVEPGAETYWDAVGWIIDAEGTQEIRPGSDEEWEAVRNAAFQVAESGNLLMMEGRAPEGDETWIAMSQAMTAMAERAIDAALARDELGVFRIGGDLYETCTACHAAYALETLRPNAQVE
ncbi:MAG: hypothetical protein GEU90_03410 [Gemmatimonas sp.]|nr:hypothetical protein [Gemmatimonas sp.]